jgi:hypothetical protein
LSQKGGINEKVWHCITSIVGRYVCVLLRRRFIQRQGKEILIKYDEEGVRKFNSLASKGYGSITQQYRGNNYIADYYWQFHPNPKIVPFVLGGNDYHLELKIGEIRVTEVTGITKAPMDESGRIVEYLVRAVPNELAEIFPSDIKSGEVQKRYAEFKKYDDGWRLLR